LPVREDGVSNKHPFFLISHGLKLLNMSVDHEILADIGKSVDTRALQQEERSSYILEMKVDYAYGPVV
jgi:hypothetical protein